MCALHAAGFGANVNPAEFHPVRARLRTELLALEGPATEALRQFYHEHELADSGATMSRYVSFALVVGPPPKFAYELRHEELPPDVLPIESFGDVLSNFYDEAQVAKLWAQVQPDYNREIRRLQEPVGQIVLTSMGYLREIFRSNSPRRFTVYVEPLVGGKTNFRNYGDHYDIVVNPGGELPLDEIRHAFLHFLLDPLPLRHRAIVAATQPLLNYAARAPRLPSVYKDDFSAFFTECLVRAVELRLRRLPAQGLEVALNQADADGFVLVRPLYRQLREGFDKAEPAMSLFFPELIRAIDVTAEAKRLQTVQFASGPTVEAEIPETAAPKRAADPGLEANLLEGERQIAAQNGAAATAAFERVLGKDPNHPRALYGLAVASVLQGDADRAKALFGRLVAPPPPEIPESAKPGPLIVAWSHVYLGRIYDVEGNREMALGEYRAALDVTGAPEAARAAAQRGIEKGRQPTPEEPDPLPR